MLYHMSEVFWWKVFALRRPGMSYYLFHLVIIHFRDHALFMKVYPIPKCGMLLSWRWLAMLAP